MCTASRPALGSSINLPRSSNVSAIYHSGSFAEAHASASCFEGNAVGDRMSTGDQGSDHASPDQCIACGNQPSAGSQQTSTAYHPGSNAGLGTVQGVNARSTNR